ncbi:flagellar protein FliO/FliZ [Clostridium tetanomorphum]|uniref:Flagellar protein n=1 Tax=Clostridium tetanomorphum TaxID=1553 RepID=A0A923E5E6_CLOTT|nr:flagellar biosynthetic protein FliO [Clostridium tetanomorphum]KAJ49922.1 flagellar formation protein [Clostridium tetanomorphum DSM 665]MBC2396673.1 flagellar biosynthetic protein FliO [Clostridium tetanomorphum]MBP1866140.1 flagellar protein FliO/FliZ [Clostridium tetanomorphum]NRS85119.1 flagellar protein FliO/FliZ [Clostridium tetanomorphum]NRZ98300.1 flagellar protein FliO/FliZ [Clostridium tetanomorphum]
MGTNLQFFITLVKIIAFLPFIIFLIYISLKYGGEKLQDIQKGKYMRILDRLPLSKENSLLIVKIGEKVYVISSASGKVEIISELKNEEIYKIEVSKNIPQYDNLRDFYKKMKNKKEE